jgi:hypothetical protein
VVGVWPFSKGVKVYHQRSRLLGPIEEDLLHVVFRQLLYPILLLTGIPLDAARLITIATLLCIFHLTVNYDGVFCCLLEG